MRSSWALLGVCGVAHGLVSLHTSSTQRSSCSARLASPASPTFVSVSTAAASEDDSDFPLDSESLKSLFPANAKAAAPVRERREPPEFAANREAARKRRLSFGFDHKAEKRNVLFEKQREFNAKRKMKPERLVQTRALASLQQGEWFEGVVRVIKPHGAWVSIGTEIDGFMHVRDLSNTEFVSDANDELRVGETVRACVKGADAEKRVLSLSLLQVDAPAGSLKSLRDFSMDEVLRDVRIKRVTPYASFLDIGADVEGYLHVSDVGFKPRMKIGGYLERNLEAEVDMLVDICWVKSIDLARNRIRLSIISPEERAEAEDADDE